MPIHTPADVESLLMEHKGLYLNTGGLFVSTTDIDLLSGYVNCEVLFPHYQIMKPLTADLVEPFLEIDVEAFLCPAVGDIALLQYATIYANEQGVVTTAAWADKLPGNTYQVQRSGFRPAIEGKRTVIINDRIAQGGTTRKIVDQARRCGAEVIGVGTLAGVSRVTGNSLGVPIVHSLCTIDIEVHPVDQAPDDWRAMPIVTDEALGHGIKFQDTHPDWPGGFVTLIS